MLSSIGMDKKQRKNITSKEGLLLGALGIVIGIIIGLLVARMAIYFLDIAIRNFNLEYNSVTLIHILYQNVEFKMKVPFFILLIAIGIVYIIEFISSNISMRKLNKMSLIEAIKSTNEIKIKGNDIAFPWLTEKIFKQEGLLAYRNIRRDKKRHKSVIFSVTISMVLFISISGFVNRTFKIDKNMKYVTYKINLSNMEEQKDKIIGYLKENDLLDEYTIDYFASSSIVLNEKQMSNELKKMIKRGIFEDTDYHRVNENKAEVLLDTDTVECGNYDEILKMVGISELKKDEVIIENNVIEWKRIGKKVPISNFKIGDILKIDGGKELKIVGILDEFPENKSVELQAYENPKICLRMRQIANEETVREISGYTNKNPFTGERGGSSGTIKLMTNKPYEIDKRKFEMNKLLTGTERVGMSNSSKYINLEPEIKGTISQKQTIQMVGGTIVRISSINCNCKYS